MQHDPIQILLKPPSFLLDARLPFLNNHYTTHNGTNDIQESHPKKRSHARHFYISNKPSSATAAFNGTTAASHWSDGFVIQSRNENVKPHRYSPKIKMKIFSFIIFLAAMLIPAASDGATLTINGIQRWNGVSSFYTNNDQFPVSTTTGSLQASSQMSLSDAIGNAFADQDSSISLSGNVLSVSGSGDCNDIFESTNGVFDGIDVESDFEFSFTIDSPFFYFIQTSLTQMNNPPINGYDHALSSQVSLGYGNNNFIFVFGDDGEVYGSGLSGSMSGILEPGTYTFSAGQGFFHAEDFNRYLLSYSDSGQYAVIFTISPSNIVTTIISGFITDACSGLPITGATVQIGYVKTASDTNGYYSQSGLPPATYNVIVSSGNYGAVTNTVTTTTSVTNLTQNFSLNSLSPLSGVTGYVYCTCDGSPITNASVVISNSLAIYSATSASDGSYSISCIPSGTFSAIVSQANYYTTNLTVTIPSDSSTVTDDFMLTPSGYDTATLNAIIPQQNIDVQAQENFGTLQMPNFEPGLFPTSIYATFTPGLGLTISQAACRLGFDHFNWFQVASGDSYKGLFYDCSSSSATYFIDPPHTNCNGTVNCITTAVNANGAIVCEDADSADPYYNEGSAYPGLFNITNHVISGGTVLTFRDTPSIYGENAGFVTSLVGVKADGTYLFINVSPFTWTTTFNGLYQGVNIIAASLLGLTNGTGEAVIIQTNVQPANIPSDALVIMVQNGGQFAVTIQPASQTVASGADASFAISPTNLSSPVNYQWRFNGTNISSATNLTLQLLNVTTNNTGIYDAVLSDSNGSIASMVASLTVVPLLITAQPTNQVSVQGSNVVFSVSVSGIGPFTYQWQFNGTNIPNSIITTVAGNGTSGYSGDGGPATNAELLGPNVAVDTTGDLFIADWSNNRVRKVDINGIITTVAGNGIGGFFGDGGAATNAELYYVGGVAVDTGGNLFITDCSNARVRKVGPNGIISTVAGNGKWGFAGDGGAATNAELYFNNYPDLAVDAAGNLFFADVENNRIRKVGTNGIITTVAGNGTAGYSGDGGAATNAELSFPNSVAVDAAGNMFIADFGNNVIRKVGTNGIITTVAGNGTAGYSGNGGAATNAELYYPLGVVVDTVGNLFIADTYNNVIREAATNGIITTVAGNSTYGYFGDGGPATDASLRSAWGVTVDSSGNLYIADFGNRRIRKVTNTQGPSLTLNDVTAANGGNYRVVVTGLGGSVTSSVVNLTITLPPIVQYTATPTNGFAPLTVQFNCPGVDSGSNAITSWNWNFGDGTSSTLQNPTHVYAIVGNLSPSLVATNNLGLPVVGSGPAINAEFNPGLVLNGDFQTGDFTGWTLSGDTSPWTFVDNGAASGIQPHSGAYVAELGTTSARGFLSQTLSTVTGQSYLLSLWLNSPDGETPNEFLVSWNGNTLFDETNILAIGWTNLQFLVSATGTSTVLEFGFRDDPSWLGLDDISVVPAQPGIASFSLSGTNLVINGSNGLSELTYYVLTSTNLALPLHLWTPVATNFLNASGNFTITVTNAVNLNVPQCFYILQMQ